MASILTTEESKALLALCRNGRLYEVEDWIRAGKSLRIAGLTQRDLGGSRAHSGILGRIEAGRSCSVNCCCWRTSQ